MEDKTEVRELVSRHAIELAKHRLTIPELWRRLQLRGKPKSSCRSPFRDEKHASFSIFANGQLAHDHATGETFDGPKFVAKALGLSIAEAIKVFVELAGCTLALCALDESQNAKQREGRPPAIIRPDLSEFYPPTQQELHAIARDRGLNYNAPLIASRLGCLKIGYVCGRRSWILTDPRGVNAEARRFGRLNLPRLG